jgi:hypothetical protein
VTSCIVDSAAIYIMVVKFRNTISPLHRSSPFIRGLRCQAIQMEHGLYITERTQKAVYIVSCLWSCGPCCQYQQARNLPQRTPSVKGPLACHFSTITLFATLTWSQQNIYIFYL